MAPVNAPSTSSETRKSIQRQAYRRSAKAARALPPLRRPSKGGQAEWKCSTQLYSQVRMSQEPETIAGIGVVYVRPPFRRSRVGRNLAAALPVARARGP